MTVGLGVGAPNRGKTAEGGFKRYQIRNESKQPNSVKLPNSALFMVMVFGKHRHWSYSGPK